MPFDSDFEAPLATTGSQGQIRNALVKRVIYVLGPTEVPTDFDALDIRHGRSAARDRLQQPDLLARRDRHDDGA
jgi:hypothetical protein